MMRPQVVLKLYFDGLVDMLLAAGWPFEKAVEEARRMEDEQSQLPPLVSGTLS